tara:strand:- start:552 stop:1394 length:843 start_codon:yes stop_codon:yes gene_type:complete
LKNISKKILYKLSNAHRKYDTLKLLIDWSISDIYIVSYPKSGVTWLCLILANIINLKRKSNDRVDFYNVHDFIPDLHANPQQIQNINQPRIIKTHEFFKEWQHRINIKGNGFMYPRVIHMVRDGRDSMASFFRYTNALSKNQINIEDFLGEKIKSKRCWSSHTKNWSGNDCLDKRKLFTIKYENMKINPFSEIKKLVDFIGFNIENEIIKKAIKLSDIENIKNLESKYGSEVQYQDKKYMFAGKGLTGEFDNDIKSSIENYFLQSKDVFEKLNYFEKGEV